MGAARILFGILVPAFLVAHGALAGDLPAPTGAPILSISGKIAITNTGDKAEFDLAMLEAMRQATVITHAPWYDGTLRFDGVPLAELMERVGATGTTVTAVALNDYVVDIPIEDFGRFGVVLALKQDGAYMPVRGKGPLFIIYPFDSDPRLQAEIFYRRAAWQVRRLVVR